MRAALVVVAAGLALSACGDTERTQSAPGEAAFWEVDPDRPPKRADRSISALVSRTECASGVTGRVLAPKVAVDEQRVVLTFTVERTPDGSADCQGNNPVKQTVELDEPVGDRVLFDGSCTSQEPKCEPRQVWPNMR